MTRSSSKPKGVDQPEKRLLDEALEEGLEETFPASDPPKCDPAAADTGGPARQAQGVKSKPKSDGNCKSSR